MKKNKFIAILLSFIFIAFTACSGDENLPENPPDEETETPIPPDEDEDEYVDPGDEALVTNSQLVSLENMISINFSAGEVNVENPFEGSGVTINKNGSHITITSEITDKELNYVVSGITSDGSVKIYGNYKFGLALNGVGITNPKGAAINIQCGKKITVTVIDETNNRLIDGETYEEVEGEDMKGTFFSEGQLNFYGNGTLEVRGKYKHAICTDDYFKMYEGNIWVKEAASDAIHAKDYTSINGGTLTTYSSGEGVDCDGYIFIDNGNLDIITAGKKGHGLKSGEYITIEGTPVINIKTEGIASKCINATGDITILNGTLNLKTTGDAYYDTDDQDTSSAAAIKTDNNLLIENGDITIKSSGSGGKGINVDGTIVVNKGNIEITTTGDQYVYDRNNDTAAKAMKSDGNLTINGGKIVVKTYRTEAEGIESKSILTIAGGDVEVEAYDDCLNASNHIQIDGGNIYCNSTTNDAIDSNGTLTVTAGVVIAAGAGSPEGGIDCDQNRFTVTGGTIIGIGGDTSSPTASVSKQPSLIYRTSASGIDIIRIEETSGGNEALTFKLPKTYTQNFTMLFSSSSLKANTGYTIYTGGTISGGSDFYGFYTGASYTNGTSANTFTTGTAGSVTTVGNASGPGGPGNPGSPGGPGGRP